MLYRGLVSLESFHLGEGKPAKHRADQRMRAIAKQRNEPRAVLRRKVAKVLKEFETAPLGSRDAEIVREGQEFISTIKARMARDNACARGIDWHKHSLVEVFGQLKHKRAMKLKDLAQL